MSNFRTVEEFEKSLTEAYWLAIISSTIHKLRNALSVGALSWAITFLLGGLTSNIPVSDHKHVSKLASLVFCLRLFAPAFSHLLTRKLKYTGSISPQNLSYDDLQVSWVMGIQIMAFLCEAGVSVVSALEVWERLASDDLKHLPIRKFLISFIWNSAKHVEQSPGLNTENPFGQCLSVNRTCSESRSEGNLTSICFTPATGIDNVRVSVLILLRLVSWTCFATIFLWIVVLMAWSCLDNEQRKYHDEVMRRGMADSIWRADEFDKIEFFLDSMGDDLAFRNIGALEVKRQNSQFLEFLYNHPTGVERILLGLSSTSVVRQQTAANIVGFWAHKNDLKKKMALLSKLAEKLGLPGKAAEGAANSFHGLAKKWSNESSSPLLKIRVAKGDAATTTCHVVEKVVDLVLDRRLPTLQVYMRDLDAFFMSKDVLEWLASSSEPPQSHFEEIKGALWLIAQRQSDPERRDNLKTGSPQAAGASDPHSEQISTEENAQAEDLLDNALLKFLRIVEWMRCMLRTLVHTVEWVCLVPFSGIAGLWHWARNKIRRNSAKDGQLERLLTKSNEDVVVDATGTNIRTRTAFLALSAWVRLSEFNDGHGLSDHQEKQLKEKLTHINNIITKLNESPEIKEVLWWDEVKRFRELWSKYGPKSGPPLHSWIDNCTKRGRRYKQD